MISFDLRRKMLLDEAKAIQEKYAITKNPNERNKLELRYIEIDQLLGKFPEEDVLSIARNIEVPTRTHVKYHTKQCPYCAETINIATIKCRFCDAMLNESKALVSHIGPRKPSNVPVALILIVMIGVITFGNIHLVTGESINGFRIIPKVSFGFAETFINIDAITGMPSIFAQSQYPISIRALRKSRLIESESQFEYRNKVELERKLKELDLHIFQ